MRPSRAARIHVLAVLMLLFSVDLCAAQSVLVETAAVRQETFGETITAYGSIRQDPATEFSVSVPRAGLIRRMYARPGRTVTAGTPLFELETAPEVAAQYAQALSALTYSAEDLAHVKRLFAEQMATRDQVAAAEKALSDARQQLKDYQAKGENVTVETVRATRPGIVIKLAAAPGDRVPPDATILTLADRSKLLAILGVEPADIGRVHVDAEVQVAPVWSKSDGTTGQVDEISAIVDPTTGLVNVAVRLPTDGAAWPIIGMPVAGDIQLAKVMALSVPHAALLREGANVFVFRVKDGKAEKAVVELIGRRDGTAFVQGPLSSGDTVVTKGVVGLADGVAVRVAGRQ